MSESQKKRVKVPTVLQMEAVECGAASLSMILEYHGKHIPLEELRVACGVSRDGSKATNILKAAKSYGLDAKGYRKEPSNLKTMDFPMIIHWNFNHFLVLEGFKNGFVYLRDPAEGARKVTEEEFDQCFTGIALTFYKSSTFVKNSKRTSTIRSLLLRLKGSESALTYIIFAGLCLVIPGLILPSFTKVFIDQVLLHERISWLYPLIIGMTFTLVVRGILTWLQEYFLLRLGTKIAITMSGKFLWHILRLPIEFFSQRFAGDISSRIQINDKVATVLSGQLATTALNFFMIIFYFILMLQYDLILTLVGVVAAIINVFFLRFVSKKRVDQSSKLIQDKGKLQGVAISGLQIMETLKASGSENDFFSKLSGYYAKVLNSEQSYGSSSQLLMAIPPLLMALTNTFVLLLGGYRVMDGYMTIGMLVAFQSLMSSFMEPVNGIVNMGSIIQDLSGNLNRLDDVMMHKLDEQSEFCENSKISPYTKLEGYIELKDITFGYSVMEPPLIENFCLHLKPGSRVALVGGSGSGKSTISKLLAGLYKPWSGEIFFDGNLKENLPKAIINNSLAVVDQDISMFSGTIRENISLWDSTVSELNIVLAAKDACIHYDISKRENGYDHILSEGGKNFSGGQRQRLEIARALCGNPSILILDEATSALDTKLEKLIDENIRKRGCTCLIVAHRLSTIRDCDEIIVMEKGKIVQRGTHNELKADIDGLYSKLINA